ncbi:hypothetical protein OG440_33145 [Streptomyces sp. NBC_00637]|uniref:hypothetical protein n=1 Tax=Streptomyces sp. NBC_00637 TaxID=2903667 RepID=UPI0032556E6E
MPADPRRADPPGRRSPPWRRAPSADGSPTSVRVFLQVMAETEGIADTVDAVEHPSPPLDA